MLRFLLVCLGGAAGSGARYMLAGALHRGLGAAFPYGTLAVNLIGSFLITGIMHAALGKNLISEDLRIVLTAGVLGGFTTYSSFNLETLRLFEQGTMGLAFLNIALTLLGCLLAGLAGLGAAKLLFGS